MNIQSTRTPTAVKAPAIPTGDAEVEAASEEQGEVTQPKEKVTFDSERGCYHFESPGLHRTKCLPSPLKAGLGTAAVVGVPAGIGAVQASMIGMGASALVTVALSPMTGMVLGGAALGFGGHKISRGHPLFVGLGTLLGAGIGGVAFPVLKSIGTFGGMAGALAATAVVGAGAAIAQVVSNNKVHEEARAAGYQQ